MGTPAISKCHVINTAKRSAPLIQTLKEGLQNVFDTGKFRGAKVLIKPNLCGPGAAPYLYSMTDPELIRSLVNIARDCGAEKITVADHAAGYVEATTEFFNALGLPSFAKEAGFDFLDLRKDGSFVDAKGVLISSVLEDHSIVINTTLPKTHHQATLSLCMKNLAMGLIEESERLDFHDSNLNEGIVNVNKIIRGNNSVIDILDARRGQQGLGPHFGDPIDLGYMIFGTDPVKVDSAGARLMGFEPEQLELFKLAKESGLGELNSEEDGDLITPFHVFASPPWEFTVDKHGNAFVFWLENPNKGKCHLYLIDRGKQIFSLAKCVEFNFVSATTQERASDWFFYEMGLSLALKMPSIGGKLTTTIESI